MREREVRLVSSCPTGCTSSTSGPSARSVKVDFISLVYARRQTRSQSEGSLGLLLMYRVPSDTNAGGVELSNQAVYHTAVVQPKRKAYKVLVAPNVPVVEETLLLLPGYRGHVVTTELPSIAQQ